MNPFFEIVYMYNAKYLFFPIVRTVYEKGSLVAFGFYFLPTGVAN